MQHKQNIENFKNLLQRYKSGTCTPEEIRLLFELVKSGEEDSFIDAALLQEFNLMFHVKEEETKKVPARFFRLHSFKKYAAIAAASAIILWGLYYFYYTNSSENRRRHLVENAVGDMTDLKQVVLTIDDGQRIILDSSSIGKIAIQAGTVISLNENGELQYNASNAQQNEKIRTNTVSTPTGGFFKIVLPDGTKVWLNSESELTFPSKFAETERNIILKGEGYFEVEKEKEKPFKVRLDRGEEITVLGTTFNVMTYKNEPVQSVTLLEGQINVSNQAYTKIIKPGQQAVLKNGQIEVSNDANIDHVIAWKNGLFDFQNDDLPTIMRQISRWYNVEIIYNESNHGEHFTGSIRKSGDIDQVLKMLEVAGDVRFFKIGSKIIVNDKK